MTDLTDRTSSGDQEGTAAQNPRLPEATARAHPNIALVKYWGKRDESLMLPAAGSLSLTLDAFATTTTVSLIDRDDDTFLLNESPGTPDQARRVSTFLDLVRSAAGSSARAAVTSTSEAPTGAGLASSAAGFAALAVAAASAYGLDLDTPALSRLARRGSGSAARSVISGLASWNAGEDDATSYAEAISGPEMRMVIVVIDAGTKAVSSRAAMRRTAVTSPYYAGWVKSTRQSHLAALDACRDDDFTRLGRITELHALRMHALIQSADPPIRYLTSRSVAAFERIEALRAAGIEAYATADAGPNVVAIVQPGDAQTVADAFRDLGAVLIAAPGPGARLLTGPVA